MSLIDYFNAFQVVSDRKHFSANVRSLYFAILGEFNKNRYPVEMFLRNDGLQYLSGIKASSSFDAARNALINAKLITHKGGLYSLCGVENKCIPIGNVVENAKSTLEVKKIKDKKTEDLTPTATARARGGNLEVEPSALKSINVAQNLPPSNVSEEVAQAWQMWENRALKMGEVIVLMNYEKEYGTAAVVSAIHEAGKTDKYDHLTLKYIEAILVGKKKSLPVRKVAPPQVRTTAPPPSVYNLED